MTVLGRGLVFQPVLVTHICAYISNNIMTLHYIDITDFPFKKKKKKRKERKKESRANTYSTTNTGSQEINKMERLPTPDVIVQALLFVI